MANEVPAHYCDDADGCAGGGGDYRGCDWDRTLDRVLAGGSGSGRKGGSEGEPVVVAQGGGGVYEYFHGSPLTSRSLYPSLSELKAVEAEALSIFLISKSAKYLFEA